MKKRISTNFKALAICAIVFFQSSLQAAIALTNLDTSVATLGVQKKASLLFEGTLKISSDGYFLQQLENAKPFKLTFTDPSSELILGRLIDGDFISVQGTKASPQDLSVVGINYIGLSSLLGTWLGDDNVCYHFKSFTSFLIFNSNQNGRCVVPKETADPKSFRKMSYLIAPDDSGWYVLISDKSTQYAAELILKNSRTVQLNLFDQESGDILSKVILRR